MSVDTTKQTMRTQKPFTVFTGIMLLAAAILTSCGGKKTTTAAGMDHVKIGYLPMVSSLTYFVATEKKYFLEQNLEIEASPIKTSDGLAQELQKSQIDVCIELSIVPLLRNSASGDQYFKIFSTSSIEADTAFDGILVRGDSPISTMQELSGKSIATFPGTTSKASIIQVFKKLYPNTPLPIFKEGIAPPDQLNSLAKGEVDAIHAYEPLMTIGLVNYKFKNAAGSVYAAQINPNPIGVGALSGPFLRERKDVAKRVVVALDKAVDFIRSHPAEARRILAKYTNAEPSICDRMRIMPMSESSKTNIPNLQEYLDILKSIGENNNPSKASDLVIQKDFTK
ncbi:MAG: hypothetical protein CFE44_13835 [Burkholderiales bacterium PBB4]|nr:MAG: hypothetical protein CFE44_13835 [Burkholderiales bacterium PBB4]